MKNNTLKVMAVLGLAMFAGGAFAQTGLNVVTTTMSNQMAGIVNVISAIAYIVGIALGIKAALKMKEHNETKGQVPLSTPIVLAVVAAVLLALPTFLKTGKEGVFGAGSTGTDLQGSTLQRIN
jgi:hypothetical protein